MGSKFRRVVSWAFASRQTTEVMRLRRALAESREQQAASAEILRAISQARGDAQPVLQTIVERSMALCGADNATLYRRDGDELVSVAAVGPGSVPIGGRAIPQGAPQRAIAERRTAHIPDALKDPLLAPLIKDPTDTARVRLAVPIMRDGEPIGVIRMIRMEPRPFTAREIQLVESFAAQAGIAMENVRLFNETQGALERQTATSEVLKVISRSAFDLQRVLDVAVESAAKLCAADTGALLRRQDDGYTVAAVWGRDAAKYTPERTETLRRTIDKRRTHPERASPNAGVVGRAAHERRPVQVEDITTDPGYREHAPDMVADALEALTPRTRLAVPLLRDGEPIGVMHLGRFEPKRFGEAEIELLSTFADQAAIAMENTRLLNELREANVALRDATEAKSKFLATMSHELRTPLNAIIGFSDVLLQRIFGELNPKQADYLTDIRTSGAHQLELINDLLDLSKIEAGKLELELEQVSIADVVSSAAMFVRERATQKSVALDTIVAEGLPLVSADGRKVKQVLVNLLTNAVKFTPAGGRVLLSAGQRDGEILVSVRDTGIGIAPDEQARLFQEFEQTRSARSSEEGTGLGLALSKRLVELHHGRIWVESEVGTGSTFTFTLPVSVTTMTQA